MGPVITKAHIDPNRPKEAIIEWGKIPDDKTNGDLIGYTIYWGITRDGKDRREYPDTVNPILVRFNFG